MSFHGNLNFEAKLFPIIPRFVLTFTNNEPKKIEYEEFWKMEIVPNDNL